MSTTSLRRRIASAITLAATMGAIAIGMFAPVANADVGYLFKSCLKGGGEMKSCCLLVGGEYHANLAGDYCIHYNGAASPQHETPPTDPTKPPAPVNTVLPALIQK